MYSCVSTTESTLPLRPNLTRLRTHIPSFVNKPLLNIEPVLRLPIRG